VKTTCDDGSLVFRIPVKTALTAGVAAVLLTSCQPMKMGSAVIIGDERITTASLDRTVRQWNEQFRADPEANMKRSRTSAPGQQLPLDSVSESEMRLALSHLVRIRISDRVAREQGIDAGNSRVDRLIEQFGGQREAESTTLALGLPVGYTRDLFRDLHIQQELLRRYGDDGVQGSERNVQANRRAVALYTETARRMNIKINPRYGTFRIDQLAVGPVVHRLSKGETGTGRAPGSAG